MAQYDHRGKRASGGWAVVHKDYKGSETNHIALLSESSCRKWRIYSARPMIAMVFPTLKSDR
jgi:hypothetical protein